MNALAIDSKRQCPFFGIRTIDQPLAFSAVLRRLFLATVVAAAAAASGNFTAATFRDFGLEISEGLHETRITGDVPVKYQVVFGIRSRAHLSSFRQ